MPGQRPGWSPVAHIHLPDGSFTLSWVLFWWLCALVLLGAALIRARVSRFGSREIAVAAFLTVAAFVAFLVEIPLFGGVHLNLTPLIGILAGPVLGTLVVFVTNVLSAAIGHGGWGLIGANVLVNVSEVVTAWAAFRALGRVTGSLFARAGLATFGGLFVGNLVMVAIILLSGIQGVSQEGAELLPGLSLVVAVNLGAAVIEAFLTGFILEYIGRVRPALLEPARS
ncbi:MAG: energy-coupling factor ABC transporter permease [Methanomicrobiales archaeon]|nr:energy-coupling factor ABC transporter permease [Methanomicrobiales archaeon]